jgi:hypothetical protein
VADGDSCIGVADGYSVFIVQITGHLGCLHMSLHLGTRIN